MRKMMNSRVEGSSTERHILSSNHSRHFVSKVNSLQRLGSSLSVYLPIMQLFFLVHGAVWNYNKVGKA